MTKYNIGSIIYHIKPSNKIGIRKVTNDMRKVMKQNIENKKGCCCCFQTVCMNTVLLSMHYDT